MTKFRPMLAGTCNDTGKLTFPIMTSPKLDGIRCTIKDGVAVARSLKQLPNRYLQEMLMGLPDGLDGEIIVGLSTTADAWNRTSSKVMSTDKEGFTFTFFVFDWYHKDSPDMKYQERYSGLQELTERLGLEWLVLVPHTHIFGLDELDSISKQYLKDGYEGAMIRSMEGPYKCGRSTEKQGYLLKIKPFMDAEFKIVGYKEKMHNSNAAKVNKLGQTQRSSAKAGKVPTGTLGSLIFEVPQSYLNLGSREADKTFEVGTGFSHAQRAVLWADGDNLIGKMAKVKYQEVTKAGKLRFPVFLGIRDEIDIGNE